MIYSLRHFLSSQSVLFFLVFVGMISGSLFPRSMAYLPAISGLIVGLTLFNKKELIKNESHILICILATILWVTFSILWSVNPEFSSERSLKIALILIPSFFLYLNVTANQYSIQDIKVLFYAFCGICITLFLERILNHPITNYFSNETVALYKLNRNFVIIAFFAIPFLFFIQQLNIPMKRLVIVLLIAVLGLILSQTQSQTAQLSFLVGIFFLFFFPAHKNLIRLFFIGLIILSCFFPFIVKPIKEAIPEHTLTSGLLKEASIIHRFEIWEFSVDSTMEKPFIGHGVDSLRFLTSDEWMPYQRDDKALHSHNIILQFWVEFGTIGAVILVIFLFMVMQKMVTVDDKRKRRLYLSVFASYACCSMTGYGFWQSWQLGFFMFLMAFTTIIANVNYKDAGNKNQ